MNDLAEYNPNHAGSAHWLPEPEPNICSGCPGAEPRWNGDTFTAMCPFAFENVNEPHVCLEERQAQEYADDRMEHRASMHN